jgi:hypothetical protein
VTGRAQVTASANDALQSMNVPEGAKATALGGAFSSIADDSDAIYWNPAGMAFQDKLQIQTTFNQYFQDSFYQDLGATVPFDSGVVGGRLSYLNFGTFTGRDNFGAPLANFSPDAWGFAVAGARRWGNFSGGLSLKYNGEFLPSYSATGISFDLGLMYRFSLLSLATGVRDISIYSNESYPTDFYGGASVKLPLGKNTLTLATDVDSLAGDTVLHHGVEFGYENIVFARLGYQWGLAQGTIQDQAGIGGGVGVNLTDLQLDYSFVSDGDLGTTNRLSLSFMFEMPKPNRYRKIYNAGTNRPVTPRIAEIQELIQYQRVSINEGVKNGTILNTRAEAMEGTLVMIESQMNAYFIGNGQKDLTDGQMIYLNQEFYANSMALYYGKQNSGSDGGSTITAPPPLPSFDSTPTIGVSPTLGIN